MNFINRKYRPVIPVICGASGQPEPFGTVHRCGPSASWTILRMTNGPCVCRSVWVYSRFAFSSRLRIDRNFFFLNKWRLGLNNSTQHGRKKKFLQVCSVARILLFLPFLFGACPGGRSEKFLISKLFTTLALRGGENSNWICIFKSLTSPTANEKWNCKVHYGYIPANLHTVNKNRNANEENNIFKRFSYSSLFIFLKTFSGKCSKNENKRGSERSRIPDLSTDANRCNGSGRINW